MDCIVRGVAQSRTLFHPLPFSGVWKKNQWEQWACLLAPGSPYSTSEMRWAVLGVVVVQSLSCVWLFCDPIDYSPPGCSVHGISPARILEWVAIFFSRGSSRPRDWTCISCISGRFFTTEPPGKSVLEIAWIKNYLLETESSLQVFVSTLELPARHREIEKF